MLRRSLSAVLAVGVAGIGIAAAVTLPAHAGSPTTHAGLTTGDAAPSCWAIKQSFPSSPDGVYWLDTAALVAPQQFYCDMTTDGGGWVLVGRGRTAGSGATPARDRRRSCTRTITGPDAFYPSTLSRQVIQGLLAGTRARRARRRHPPPPRHEHRRHELAGGALAPREHLRLVVGARRRHSPSRASRTARRARRRRTRRRAPPTTALDNAYNRAILDTQGAATQADDGLRVRPERGRRRSATSYLAPASAAGERRAAVHPGVDPPAGRRRAGAGFTTFPTRALRHRRLSWLPQNQPQTFHWGVVGVQKVADPDSDNDAPAHASQQMGNTMFVGGKFAAVQNGAGGAQYAQPWLAAFDVQTGTWISTFRPQLDGEVFTLAAAPERQPHRRRRLHERERCAEHRRPRRARPDDRRSRCPASPLRLVARASARTRPYVRKVAVSGNWLYVGGGFNRIAGGRGPQDGSAAGLGRVSLADGTPDSTWKAATDLPVVDIYPSDDGTRVYVAGFFHNVDNTPGIDSAAVLDTTTGALVPGMNRPQFDQGNQKWWYQYAIFQYGSNVYLGGSQHALQEYTHDSSFSLRHRARHPVGRRLPGRARRTTAWCSVAATATSTTTPTPTRGRLPHELLAGDHVELAERLRRQRPREGDRLRAAVGHGHERRRRVGPHARQLQLPRGPRATWCAARCTATTYDWLGGFARFCARDTTAPSTPTNFAVHGKTSSWSGVDRRLRCRAELRGASATTGCSRTTQQHDDRDERTRAATSCGPSTPPATVRHRRSS